MHVMELGQEMERLLPADGVAGAGASIAVATEFSRSRRRSTPRRPLSRWCHAAPPRTLATRSRRPGRARRDTSPDQSAGVGRG
jgi:hypothetical protein